MTVNTASPPTPVCIESLGEVRIESLCDVQLRLARPHERPRWDKLMREQHFLRFKQFAGRGLRYIAEYQGQWVALLGWQTGAFQCAPRDRWLGWPRNLQFQRLHLIGNNTRFLILPGVTGRQNLGSYVLAANLRRLSADWQAEWGHALEMAEAFVNPSLHDGAVYKAANFVELGTTKGYARCNGKYTDKPGQPKRLLVYPLRPDARARLSAPEEQPEWRSPAQHVPHDPARLRSLRELFAELDDFRTGPARKHPLAAVLCLIVLAKLSGLHGGRKVESFAKGLPQQDLAAVGCCYDRRAKVYRVPSDTTFQRVLEFLDPQALERVLDIWASQRCPKPPKALAGDGKRIRGANRLSGADEHWETVTLVDHASGLPVASRSYREAGGEPAAMRALFEEVPLAGTTVTLDAGHTSADTVRALREQHQADVLCRVKGNCAATYARLRGLPWKHPAVRRYGEKWTPGSGRWERRTMAVVAVAAEDWEPFPDVQQVFQVTYRSKPTREAPTKVEKVHYGLTSLPPERASACRLLTLHRGHWTVESRNHFTRDVSLLEDSSHIRTGHGPANNAALNNLVLALIKHSAKPGEKNQSIGDRMAHYAANREAALAALLARQ